MPRHCKTRRAGRQHGRKDRLDNSNAEQNGSDMPLATENFLSFYGQQKFFIDMNSSDESWAQDWYNVLRHPLPVTVRINNHKQGVAKLVEAFRKDGRWRELEWYPGCYVFEAHGYAFDKSMKSFVDSLNKSYRLRFQEIVSMLPVLFWDVEKLGAAARARGRTTPAIFDMCSAPGSKTLQTFELLKSLSNPSAGSEIIRERSDFGALKPPRGLVIANDADPQRCMELLPLILRKAANPGTVVTLGSAIKFPSSYQPTADDPNKPFLFDGVLCDVPCSGDGTLRKSLNLWKTWSPHFALSLHTKQLSILLHGLHLLQVGGRLVYSTCSMNPIENEAVVAAALKKYGMTVRLCDKGCVALKDFSVGVAWTSWFVPIPSESSADKSSDETSKENVDVSFEFISSFEQCQAKYKRSTRLQHGLVESMFPPCPIRDSRVVELLKHCTRIWPHENNTGGFFFCVFIKDSHIFGGEVANISNSNAEAVAENIADNIDSKDKVQDQNGIQSDIDYSKPLSWRGRNDLNHYELLKPDDDVVKSIENMFGIETLPQPLIAEFNIKGKLRQINLASPELVEFLQCEIRSKRSPILVCVGTPLFKMIDDNYMTEIDLSCRWRPALAGCNYIAASCSKRILRVPSKMLKAWTETREISMQRFRSLCDEKIVVGADSLNDDLGPVLVGLTKDKEQRQGPFWIPAMLHGKGLSLYANLQECGSPVVPDSCPTLCVGTDLEKLSRYTAPLSLDFNQKSQV